MPKKNDYALHETIADIAFIAGAKRYHSGDSREDVENFIKWAHEFQQKNRGRQWGTHGHDYMEEIEKLAKEKLDQ
jgi:hypothetical protein